MRPLIAVLLVSALSPSAFAQGDPAAAKKHYLAGKTAFDNKDYTTAIEEFKAGYELTEPRKIEFLLNIGTAYRLRDSEGDLEQARISYQVYVDKAPESDPQRNKTLEVIVGIDKELRIREANKPKPPVVVEQPRPDLTVTAPPPPVEPKRSKLWLIAIPIAAVVIAAVAIGVYFGTQSNQVDCGSVALGCIDASR
jgi:hypothetical protein